MLLIMPDPMEKTKLIAPYGGKLVNLRADAEERRQLLEL
jgi:hypothetical protein